MRCEDIQNELTRDDIPAGLRQLVDSHIGGCSTCSNVQLLHNRINESLKRYRAWTPPPGFATRIAAHALPSLQAGSRARRFTPHAYGAPFVSFVYLLRGLYDQIALGAKGYVWAARQCWSVMFHL